MWGPKRTKEEENAQPPEPAWMSVADPMKKARMVGLKLTTRKDLWSLKHVKGRNVQGMKPTREECT